MTCHSLAPPSRPRTRTKALPLIFTVQASMESVLRVDLGGLFGGSGCKCLELNWQTFASTLFASFSPAGRRRGASQSAQLPPPPPPVLARRRRRSAL